MSVPPFATVAASYARLWDELVPTPSRVPELENIAHRLMTHKATYQAVAAEVWGNAGFWYVVALIDQMEGGGGADTYLGNGQSLHERTTEVPAGRGPFSSFQAGAIDALNLDNMNLVHDWSPASLGYHLEGWNGWGYLNKPIVDPYLASWSNKYTKGKYVADHVYDPEAVSEQPGALTILKVLVTLDKTIDLSGGAPAPAPVPTTTTAPEKAPVATPTASFKIDFNTIEKQLEGALAAINGFAFLLPPQLRGILAFAPVVEGALKVAGDLQTADWSHGSIAGILSTELRKMADAIDAGAPKS